jgi:VWFA-related protein
MKIRARVLLVNTFATVVDANGKLVANLDEKDFQVTDNGVLQKIAYFDLGRTPLSLVFLIETSSRIEPLLSEMRRTGAIFGDTVMGPDDEAAVVGFNDSVDHLADFTTDHKIVQNTISKFDVGTEGSKLFDAMAVGVEMLSSRLQSRSVPDLRERRPIIVIMSEATDFGSETRLDTVLRRAQLSNITIYSIGIPTTLAELEAPAKDVRHHLSPEGIFLLPPMPGIVQTSSTEEVRNGYGNLMNLNVWAVRNVKDKITGHALQIAAAGTGGHHIATFGGTSMEKAVDEIGGELHLQYSLTYELKGTKEMGYHEIRVHVNHKDLKVRARPGYYIAPPER